VNAALVKSNFGFLRLEARQYESAAAFFRQAIREIEIASSPDNQALIRPLVNLARCENMSGHANQAEPLARRAVELSVKVFGEEHPATATAMLEQATALRRLRRKGLARDLEKRAKACLRNNSTTNLAGYTVSLLEHWSNNPVDVRDRLQCKPRRLRSGNPHKKRKKMKTKIQTNISAFDRLRCF
jgi:hypothetical protein